MKKIWVVSVVERGFASFVKPFSKEADALEFYRKQEISLNPDYDDIEIFHIPIPQEK